MDEIYNKEYYERGCGPIPYEGPEEWLHFFGMIATQIVEEFHPKTVLDAGCAVGYLVAALRDLGVEAYGVDISDYAISRVREDVRPYCAVRSLTDSLPDNFPKHFDLVTNIEVMEHLSPEDGAKAIKNLCQLTDWIVFSSSPDDYEEPTHINVQQREYWAMEFAKNGFFRDLEKRPDFIAPQAVYFVRSDEDVAIGALESKIRYMEIAVAEKDESIASLRQESADLIQRTEKIEDQLATAQQQLAQARQAYAIISNAFFWKITAPLRKLADMLKPPLKKITPLRLIVKGLRSLKRNGFSYTWQKVKLKLRSHNDLKTLADRPLFTEEELQQQRKYKFAKDIKFSIVVPLYNTPEKFLREMIQSVIDQTYANWELCMADGSDAEHGDVERICTEYAEKDSRIKYQKLEKNLGISGNTNACLDMATGDYIGLFDHDDLLHPSALYEVMRAICEKGADFIYTDENTFHHKPEDAFCPHFKPDYAPDTLRANNYICHFTVFKKSLLDVVGQFDPACDGSQDFDIVLRLTEHAESIVHIPEILYYWRAHENSVADNVAAKPYVIEAAHRAIGNHLRRIGLDGEVLDSVVPSMYRLHYQIKGMPLVSILIPNKDHVSELKACLDSIYGKSTYKNFEIIVIENNSVEAETFRYYETIKKCWSNLKIVYLSGPFNYSAINNYGAKCAQGEHLILLNNDTEIISPDWIQEMLMYCQRSDIGAVGAKLYYPDDTIQHAGVGIGILSLAGHLHRGFDRSHPGYMGRLIYAQNLSAVTAACIMVRRDVWDQVGGLDESFEVAFNDVDLCMRIRQAGYLIVWTPYAELYHYESKTRGLEDTQEKRKRFEAEVLRFQHRWAKELADGDPYYNPNFTLDREDFSLR